MYVYVCMYVVFSLYFMRIYIELQGLMSFRVKNLKFMVHTKKEISLLLVEMFRLVIPTDGVQAVYIILV